MPLPSLSLVGFLDETSAINYLRAACTVTTAPVHALSQRWRDAKNALGLVTNREGKPDIQDIPPEYAGYLEGVPSNPRFELTVSRDVRVLPWSIRLVEIDALLAWQLHVLKGRIDEVTSSLSHPPTMDEMLRLCLPHAVESVQFTTTRLSDKSILVQSDSLNCAPLVGEIVWSEDSQLTVAGMAFGAKTPIVQVVVFDGRYYLHNGYHRACGLRKAGATHMPCLVTEGAVYSDAALVVGGLPPATVLSAHPPVVGHFTQGKAYPVQVRKLKTEFTLSYGWSPPRYLSAE